MAGQPPDAQAIGNAYEHYVGRWSRAVARRFIDWLAVPAGARWLDVGCGTGALSATIVERAAPKSVTGIDPSQGFVAHARRTVSDARVRFEIGDARALPVPDGGCDAAVSGLVLNFVPEPARAVAEMTRATRPDGTVAAYLWDYDGEMQLMRRFWDQAVALDTDARALGEGRRFPLCRPEPLEALFVGAGLRDVAVDAIDVPTVFTDFDDYWTPFLSGHGTVPGYCMSLSEDKRAALREALRATLRAKPDGRIELMARAWAVRGVVA